MADGRMEEYYFYKQRCGRRYYEKVRSRNPNMPPAGLSTRGYSLG